MRSVSTGSGENHVRRPPGRILGQTFTQRVTLVENRKGRHAPIKRIGRGSR